MYFSWVFSSQSKAFLTRLGKIRNWIKYFLLQLKTVWWRPTAGWGRVQRAFATLYQPQGWGVGILNHISTIHVMPASRIHLIHSNFETYRSSSCLSSWSHFLDCSTSTSLNMSNIRFWRSDKSANHKQCYKHFQSNVIGAKVIIECSFMKDVGGGVVETLK